MRLGNITLTEDVCAALLPPELREEFFLLLSEEESGSLNEGSEMRLHLLRKKAKATLARADALEMV